MHNEDIERGPLDVDADTQEAIVAADDTGMLRQQETLVHDELDGAIGDAETGTGGEAERA